MSKPKPDCPDCKGSGYVNDMGPGIGGKEYMPCDCVPRQRAPHYNSLGDVFAQREKMENRILDLERENAALRESLRLAVPISVHTLHPPTGGK